MIKAYSVAHIRDAEAPLLAAGEPLMQHAAAALATACIRLLRCRGGVYGARVLVLVGGGNNGGDALFAAARLARRGCTVRVICCAEGMHAAGWRAAKCVGAREVAAAEAELEAARADLIIDGILGIGARGGIREPAAGIVMAVGRGISGARAAVVAVDVPSGVDVDTGGVEGPALPANLTVTMGANKPALLLEPARRLAGHVMVVPLGYELPAPDLRAVEASDAAALLCAPGPDDSKYTRGVVGVRAGTEQYPGAGLMATAAALAAGPGMVRYLGADAVAELIIRAHPEVVRANGRVQAHVVGPGGAAGETDVREVLASGLPAVIDAEAILVAASIGGLAEHHVLTPHAGEAVALAAHLGLSREGAPWSRALIEAHQLEAARALAAATGATVMLKGAVDVVAAPTGDAYAQGGAPGWRGTAGAGDVLAGLTGGLLAHAAALAMEPGGAARVAATAAYIHGVAAAIAADTLFNDPANRAGHPIGATDIAASIPAAIEAIRKAA
ncbi:NAD(P)H-hydrate epimerase [Neoactinobaculum massilliense]|uniref:NAD(P)H-hydrate epimerase n=1 Tax=Neoactinobaculum massilliense TaxID=2364794 RepID=UPI000F526BA6|nr:NAD(P)H-hydrate epimerase [Neoactinobaculum massilliense]